MDTDSILLCTDGKSHSRRAEEWAFRLASEFRASLTVLHVRDIFLKQFYNEIYAQGRREYLEHVDAELVREAEAVKVHISKCCLANDIACHFRVRYGEPLEEILDEVEKGGYDLVVVGGKKLRGIRAFRSWNLPARLSSRLGDTSILIVRETDP